MSELKKNPQKNILMLFGLHYISLLCSIGLVYVFYIWNGSLYNALVVEESKTLRDWLFIFGSIGIFPVIFISFVLNAKSIWSLFDFDHNRNIQTIQDDLIKKDPPSSHGQ